MMFLLRSAFWLGLVFSWMPLERSEMTRVLADAQISLASHIEAAAAAGCADSAVACGAALAADRALAAAPNHAPVAAESNGAKEELAKSAAKKASSRPSADSLSASDLAPAWRGRKAKSGA